MPVLIGTGAEDTREVVRLSRRAEQFGADGVMIIPPFYCTPTDDELFHHYKTVSDAIGIPIMIYNNPATANVDLRPPLVARLSEIPNCRYIKESTLEVTRVRDIIRLCGERMHVFGGILGFESFIEGAVGWVAVASNVIPGPLARLFELVADKHNLLDARALYLEYLPVIEFVGGQAYVAGTKALLAHMGMPVGLPRPPRLPLSAEQNAAAGRGWSRNSIFAVGGRNRRDWCRTVRVGRRAIRRTARIVGSHRATHVHGGKNEKNPERSPRLCRRNA